MTRSISAYVWYKSLDKDELVWAGVVAIRSWARISAADIRTSTVNRSENQWKDHSSWRLQKAWRYDLITEKMNILTQFSFQTMSFSPPVTKNNTAVFEPTPMIEAMDSTVHNPPCDFDWIRTPRAARVRHKYIGIQSATPATLPRMKTTKRYVQLVSGMMVPILLILLSWIVKFNTSAVISLDEITLDSCGLGKFQFDSSTYPGIYFGGGDWIWVGEMAGPSCLFPC